MYVCLKFYFSESALYKSIVSTRFSMRIISYQFSLAASVNSNPLAQPYIFLLSEATAYRISFVSSRQVAPGDAHIAFTRDFATQRLIVRTKWWLRQDFLREEGRFFENFEKISKEFAKMQYFRLFFKRFNKRWVNFSLFWKKNAKSWEISRKSLNFLMIIL